MIVGGGPAGAVMAHRLTEDSDRRVLLIEAGPDYGPEADQWPEDLTFPQQQALESHSWDLYDAESGLKLHRAKVIGGSSAVNACYWIRCSGTDFDHWESLGNSGWGFEGLLPYMKKAESDPLGGPLHGTDGPVQVWRHDDWSAADLAYIEAAKSLGLSEVDDINGDPVQIPSVGPVPKNIVDGVRFNSALSYLNPIRGRSNLTIMAENLVDRVRFDGERAIGVTLANGTDIDADLVVLAAGAYFTPGILNRSGYGRAADLERLGIPVLKDLPGVGQNLLDHPFSIGTIEGVIHPDAVFGAKLQGQAMVRNRASSSTEEIDYHVYLAQYYDDELDAWLGGLAVSMVNAKSTGSVTLTSTDPTVLPHVEHRHLSDPGDMERMCDGVEFSQELLSTSEMGEVLDVIEDRRWKWSNRDELRSVIREKSDTTNHCSGTAKMGPDSDPLAVVDATGHVYGAENLVVADSSVFPTCPRGNIHFPVVAVAEKIADGLTE